MRGLRSTSAGPARNSRTRLTGMAKLSLRPHQAAHDDPDQFPFLSTTGPPEFPGLTEASSWIIDSLPAFLRSAVIVPVLTLTDGYPLSAASIRPNG